jgi:hypothetical protein
MGGQCFGAKSVVKPTHSMVRPEPLALSPLFPSGFMLEDKIQGRGEPRGQLHSVVMECGFRPQSSLGPGLLQDQTIAWAAQNVKGTRS